MHWPRGKYNGLRIVGISFKVQIQFQDWLWLPMRIRHCGGLHWLCVRTWTAWVFERKDQPS